MPDIFITDSALKKPPMWYSTSYSHDYCVCSCCCLKGTQLAALNVDLEAAAVTIVEM